MKNNKIKTLFLSAWYPHRYDAMAGLFVRKHAEAVGRNADVCVLYLHSDKTVKQFEIINQNFENIKEIYVYYPVAKNKLFKAINYILAFLKGYKSVKKIFGKPNITQVNVLTRNGVLAYLLKKTEKIPYLIIEHWTRYLPQNFSYSGFLHKKATELVARNAEKIMPVSENLAKAMQKNGIKGKYEVLYNVADDFFFEKQLNSQRNNGKKRILHVSCFLDMQKNISGILRTAKELSKERSDFELVLVGTGIDFEKIYNYAQSLKFPENMLFFTGELPPQEVAEWFSKSDIFVMFSNYENAPVVISESLAMGIPVISSDVGGIAEMIDRGCGILVEMQNEAQLFEKLNFMLDNLEKYNYRKIKEYAEKYSYDSVGEKLFNFYNNLLM